VIMENCHFRGLWVCMLKYDQLIISSYCDTGASEMRKDILAALRGETVGSLQTETDR
ncbi:Uncharacterized protein DAT39_000189, partial [Clarias magur]